VLVLVPPCAARMPPLLKRESPTAETPGKRAKSEWKPDRGYQPLGFCAFVAERQAVHARRQEGLPQAKWTEDAVLQHGRFCCIDRRDDAVTRELLDVLGQLPSDELKVTLAIVLRFTSSRRGSAHEIASLLNEGGSSKDGTPIAAALIGDQIKCGQGTYQMTLNRKQIANRAERCAKRVVECVAEQGPFEDVAGATAFIAEQMALRKQDGDSCRDMLPSFSAAETAKDLAYVGGMLHADASKHCRLGPGARAGLSHVVAREPELLGGDGPRDDEARVAVLCSKLRATRGTDGCQRLAWIEPIDVEQALCEFSKYLRYVSEGVKGSTFFEPGLRAAVPPKA